jgi:thioredoxin-related protein
VELPRVEELWRRYRNRGFSAVALEANRDHEMAVKFIKDKGLTMYMLENGEENDIVADVFHIESFPTMFIIDGEGKIIFYHRCSDQVDEKTLEEEVLKLLSE